MSKCVCCGGSGLLHDGKRSWECDVCQNERGK